jgi:Ca-activated chloride channel homolog
MRIRRFYRLILGLACLAIASLGYAQEPTPAKSAASQRTITLGLIVTDQNNHALDDVNQSDIQIRENNVPQSLVSLTKDERPLDLAIAIDTSGSFRGVLPYAISAAKQIIQGSRPTDEIFIEGFISSDKITTVQEFTSDKDLLEQRLKKMNVEMGQSAVIDAVYVAAQHTVSHHSGDDHRRALVLITDGEDRASYYTKEGLIEWLRARDVQLFVIGLLGDLDRQGATLNARQKAQELLNKLAGVSGGRVFLPKKVSELDFAVTEIIHDLHKQFLLTYQSSGKTPDNFQRIEVNIRNAENEKRNATTRGGYFLNPPDLERKPDKKKEK